MNTVILRGTPASLGIAKGPIKILNTVSDVARVDKGDILVFEMSDDLYKQAIDIAAGVITDSGGLMIHAAIKSRQLGILCIVNAKNASKILKEGMLIILDGIKGEILSQ